MYCGCGSGDNSKGEARNGNDNKGEARIQYNKGEARNGNDGGNKGMTANTPTGEACERYGTASITQCQSGPARVRGR